ncbi:hypothetical protein [Streptomyces aureus]|uniref:hypothetical protein n=1 Tax=Streptomyces aureus TaxID=193461 RepID=UPI000B1407A1|nr:hypothetical protein [Streptomyces aureus]
MTEPQLDSVARGSPEHAHGTATDVPGHLRAVEAPLAIEGGAAPAHEGDGASPAL